MLTCSACALTTPPRNNKSIPRARAFVKGFGIFFSKKKKTAEKLSAAKKAVKLFVYRVEQIEEPKQEFG